MRIGKKLPIYLNVLIIVFSIIVIVAFVSGLVIVSRRLIDTLSSVKKETEEEQTVPHEEKWGIYSLDLESEDVELIYSSSEKTSSLSLANSGDKFLFSQKVGCSEDICEEIFTLSIDGSDIQQLTSNSYWNLYPVWSWDDSEIAFLSFRDTMDIYKMNSDGSNMGELYDSGFHDSDISWVGDKIAFTRNSQIWIMNDEGTGATQLTNPPRASERGNANLPFGDYDPRISPDGTKVAFERLVDDASEHGNYDIFVINVDGTSEIRLTDTGYSQGFAVWSHAGDKIVYLVAAIEDEGKYEVYMMNADGGDNRNITPDYFPSGFLCHSSHFSQDDSKVYFIGEWY